MAQSQERMERDFFVGITEEPHATRRGEILKAHPEIKSLMGPEWRTKYIVLATVSIQIFMAWLTLEWRWPLYLLAAYVVGATANHSLFLAIHELAHNLGAHSIAGNKIIGVLANFPIGIPYAVNFKPFHMEHHRYQGKDGSDTDIPTYVEGWLITRTATCYLDHTVRKALFMFCQIFAYALRPLLIKPDLVPWGPWMFCNWGIQFAFDGLMVYLFGPKVMLYFLFSTFFAGSIHPTAGHFIAEHYVMEGSVETYSYYGPLNWLTYNVGYHNEHHDFPNIAWSSLPKVRAAAPEYYDKLPQCKSWVGTLARYIFDDSISPFSRVKRQPKKE
eukprot:TRINITY_DN32145_c0_g1_i1.p1 TRINITY_DN32145_c0_g1~~TRINITY_DN32145_c0_g1_i1.p1  ORF type:complete len:330 (+),score=32.25 TRINITY_DN32145_c0_g1_i1:97-1086(+)